MIDPSVPPRPAARFPAKFVRESGAVFAALALVLLVAPAACRRKEAPERTGAAARSTTPKRPAEPTEPSILSAPAPGRPPFAGMSEPRDAAVDAQGRLWVADFGNSRIRLFDRNGGYLGGWGNPGNETFTLRQPAGVAARGEDLYVADTWNGRIQYYTLKGEWKATAAGFFGPRGVAAAPDGKVWATDTGNHKVVVFNRSLGEPRASLERLICAELERLAALVLRAPRHPHPHSRGASEDGQRRRHAAAGALDQDRHARGDPGPPEQHPVCGQPRRG